MPTQPKYPRAHVERSAEGTWGIALVPAKDAHRRLHPAYHADQHTAMTVAADIVRTERAKFTPPSAPAPPTQQSAVVATREALQGVEEQLRKERLAKMPKPVPTRCPDCKRRVRKASQKASDWPGTVCMTDKDGHCAKCRRARQSAIIAADAEQTRREAEEAAAARTAEEAAASERAAAAVAAARADREAAAAKAAEAPTTAAPDALAAVEDLEPEARGRGPASKKRAAPAKPRRTNKGTKTDPTHACSIEDCGTGVTRHKSSGLCNFHHAEAKLAAPLTPAERQAKEALDAFTAGRRRRGIPTEGKKTA